jgi:hypothetical protein
MQPEPFPALLIHLPDSFPSAVTLPTHPIQTGTRRMGDFDILEELPK